MAYDAKLAGENIRCERLKRRMSQDELGKKVGVSRGTIGNYEDGTCNPTTETACALADVFGLSLDRLFGFKPQNEGGGSH